MGAAAPVLNALGAFASAAAAVQQMRSPLLKPPEAKAPASAAIAQTAPRARGPGAKPYGGTLLTGATGLTAGSTNLGRNTLLGQ